MTDHRDVVEAFLDQEPVEAQALERALADADGREYFMDLLVLRGLVGNPSMRAVAAVSARPERRSQRRPVAWLAAAAALVAVSMMGGYMAGRVINRPAPAPTSRVEQAGTTPAAPAPTHVIRLENGVTWNEKSGGN